MKEFVPEIFERETSGPLNEPTKTEIMVDMARLGILAAFSPEDLERQPNEGFSNLPDFKGRITSEICRSNPHPSLNAADVRKNRK